MKAQFKESLRHLLNPVHVYCRLCDLGLSRRMARQFASGWENRVYRFIL
jgi:hypothetical protein